MQIIKRKIRSAIWRLQNAIRQAYQSTVKFAVELLTERYWLLDYLPTFFKKRQSVLLVRLDLIGDFVLWLDSAKAYRKIYPDQKITLAVNSICAELARTLTFWDEVITIDVHRLRTDFVYRLRVAVLLRCRNFATAIQPTFSRERVGDFAIRSTKAQARIGYVGDTNNISIDQKNHSDLWYSHLVSNDHTCTMELNINAHFVRELGYRNFMASLPIIPKTSVSSERFIFTKPYVVISPGASWQSRMWPITHFASAIEQLNLQFDIHFVICGSKADEADCEDLMRESCASNVTNLAGKTSLLELIEIIRSAALVITNESSPVHIAAATGTPSVCILGGGHFGRFLPYQIDSHLQSQLPIALWNEMDCFGCRWKCKFVLRDRDVVPCISNVSLQEVMRSCRAVLLTR